MHIKYLFILCLLLATKSFAGSYLGFDVCKETLSGIENKLTAQSISNYSVMKHDEEITTIWLEEYPVVTNRIGVSLLLFRNKLFSISFALNNELTEMLIEKYGEEKSIQYGAIVNPNTGKFREDGLTSFYKNKKDRSVSILTLMNRSEHLIYYQCTPHVKELRKYLTNSTRELRNSTKLKILGNEL